MRNDNAFTGLEAAIVLIAFVVVAAVFSYVVLGAGFFTTQKSQEVVHTSVSQTSSSIEVIGNVFGKKDTTGTSVFIDELQFNLGLTAGGAPVDMSKVILTYSTDAVAPLYLAMVGSPSQATPGWMIAEKNDGADNDNLLERGEIFTIQVVVKKEHGFGVNDQMNLEIKPPVGAVLGLKRTAPPQLDAWNVLY